MQHLDLDYEDASETVITGRPTTDLHDLRVVLVTTNPVVARRVERILTPMGARIAMIPDWGHVSISEIRGLDPQLVLLEPNADLKGRADAIRRLAEEPRLTWAVIDRIPRGLDTQVGVDRLVELAAVALGPDRQLQAEIILAHGEDDGRVVPIDALGPGRLLRALVITEGSFELHYQEDSVDASLVISNGALIEAHWVEKGPDANHLQGVAALTAFTALRQGEVRIVPIADREGPGIGLLANTLEEAAAPDLSWVATRVATGRYLFPPPGVESKSEGDLPEASRTRRERPEGVVPPPADIAPLPGSPTMPGVAGLPLVIPEMPRMPRPQGPKQVMDEKKHSPLEVAISSIVNLTPAEVEVAKDDEAGDYDDMEVSSLNLDVEVETEAATEAPAPSPMIPPTAAVPVVSGTLHTDATLPPAAAPTPSVWPNEPAPVSAADSIRPSLAPVQVPQRRIWPWALAALALLGLVVGGGAVALVGSSTIASYAEDPAEIFAQIEDLGLDVEVEELSAEEPLAPAGAEVSAPAPAASIVVEAADEENDEAEMVFELEEAHPATADEEQEEEEDGSSRRRRRRALRRQIGELLEQAHDAPSAEAAATLYHEVLELDSGEIRALRGLARANMVMGNYPAAVRFAEEATRARPRDAASWGLLGDIHRRAGNTDSAERAYERATALDPNTATPPVAEQSEPAEAESVDPADVDDLEMEPEEAPAEAPAPEATPAQAPAPSSATPDRLAPRQPGAGLPPAL
jgi:hypothetical protein